MLIIPRFLKMFLTDGLQTVNIEDVEQYSDDVKRFLKIVKDR